MPEDDTLHTWMEKVRHETVPRPATAPSPLVIRPVTYAPADYLDPFDAVKITALPSATGSGPQPDPQEPGSRLKTIRWTAFAWSAVCSDRGRLLR